MFGLETAVMDIMRRRLPPGTRFPFANQSDIFWIYPACKLVMLYFLKADVGSTGIQANFPVGRKISK